MIAPRVLLSCCGLALAGTTAHAQFAATFNDPPSDAVLRRTDPGSNGLLPPNAQLPELLSLTLRPWQPLNPASDPFTGTEVPPDHATIFRLDVEFAGLVNPPGTLGLSGLPYNPAAFGPSPVFGFIDLDIDRDRDTGGELGGAATVRYLANVGRFGKLPYGSISARTAWSAAAYDAGFNTPPQIERSGADFSLQFCGCFATSIVSRQGDADNTFETGETWLVRGRYWARAGGYQGASTVFGGSAPGLYDPPVNVRFAHSAALNRTMVSLVAALDQTGAALLAGQPDQPIDSSVSNHTSVEEAVTDLVENAPGLTGPVMVLTQRWEGRDPRAVLDPTDWDVRALVGAGYASAGEGALYAWTDTGFDESAGDLDADGLLSSADLAIFDQTLGSLDGSGTDADGAANGVYVVQNQGPNFSLIDFDADGIVGPADRQRLAPACPPDVNADTTLDAFDFNAFVDAFNAGNLGLADINADTTLDAFDFNAFVDAFNAGCF